MDALGTATAWAVVPHRLPDVDALAAGAALCLVLRAKGRVAHLAAPEVPDVHRWVLPEGMGGDTAPTGALIAVDTARRERLQVGGAVALNIDHHEDNPGYGAVNWVVAAPSCTCLVAGLAEALAVPVTPALATLFYIGLYGDTEGFRVGAHAQAFRWAARFAAAGADTEWVAEQYHRRSPGFWAYLAAAEASAVELPGPSTCRVVPIARELPARYGLRPYENALLPSYISPPAGGVLVILQEGRDNVRLRLRSRGVDVLPLAHALGGGGHPQAAGVVLQGVDLPAALDRLRIAWQRLAQPGCG